MADDIRCGRRRRLAMAGASGDVVSVSDELDVEGVEDGVVVMTILANFCRRSSPDFRWRR